MTDPLMLPEWQEFNRRQWNVEPHTVEFAPRGPNGQTLRVVTYRDRRGHFVLPTMNPHWPMDLHTTKTDSPARLQRQWTELAELFVEEMTIAGTRGRLALPPELPDVRPWQWAGFRVMPLHTFYLEFPYSITQADPQVRQKIRKAQQAKFTCRRAEDLDDFLACLRGTEDRQGFDHELTRESLRNGLQLMGPDVFRLYVAYSSDGEPASSRLILHTPGGRACDLACGTTHKHMPTGATQLLLAHALEELQQDGASGFNFCCANIQSVSPSKANWGGQLLTQFAIEGFDYVPLKRIAGSFVRLWKHRRTVLKRRSEALEKVTEPSVEATAMEKQTNKQESRELCEVH